VRAAGRAGSVQGVAGVMARAQGAVRGAGAHLSASIAACSTRRRPCRRRGRRAMMYGRRLKPAPGLSAAPSLALALSTRLHRARYLERAKKGREALFGAGTNGRPYEAARPTFRPRARGQGLGSLAPAVRRRCLIQTRPVQPGCSSARSKGAWDNERRPIPYLRRGHLKAC